MQRSLIEQTARQSSVYVRQTSPSGLRSCSCRWRTHALASGKSSLHPPLIHYRWAMIILIVGCWRN